MFPKTRESREIIPDFKLTPAQQIIDLLRTIKLSNHENNDASLINKIEYAIEKIGQKNIYDVDIVQSLDLATTRK